MRFWLILAVLFFSLTGFSDEITVTKDADYDPSLPVGALYHAAFLHDATTFTDGSALSELVDISYEKLSVATVQVSSNSATAGAITTASYEIVLSLTSDKQSPSYNLERGNAADTYVWAPLITITNYGIYNIPIGAARYMRIIAHGEDDAARRVDIGLR